MKILHRWAGVFVVAGGLTVAGTWSRGGEPVDAKAVVLDSPDSLLPPWAVPSLDSRFRWEYGDEDGRDTSHALTLRNRAGLLLKPAGGQSLQRI